MSLVDFHTHILPGIDDGSSSVEMSRSMLEEEKRQGVGTVILTPHFYVNERTPARFLEKRLTALQSILPIGRELGLKLVPGAEVYYFEGIRTFPELEELTIKGSGILLLEMPFSRWTERLVKEVVGMAGTRNVSIVLAHIDRYSGYYTDDQLTELLQTGVRLQMNADYIAGSFTKRKAMKMIEEGIISHVGSDCHNMRGRRPNIEDAAEVIAKKMKPELIIR